MISKLQVQPQNDNLYCLAVGHPGDFHLVHLSSGSSLLDMDSTGGLGWLEGGGRQLQTACQRIHKLSIPNTLD